MTADSAVTRVDSTITTVQLELIAQQMAIANTVQVEYNPCKFAAISDMTLYTKTNIT